MDLMQPETIDAFTDWFLASGRPLNILINNAGIMATPLRRDERGFESQFATNHLGHFQLTSGLWKALKLAGTARVVNVSSLGHRYSDIIYEDPNFEHIPYDRWKAYGQSKTANILFSVQLDALGKEHGIRSYALHPGRIVDTNLKKYLTKEDLIKFNVLNEDGTRKDDPNMKTIEQGASTTIFCATSPSLANTGGVYCEDDHIAEVLGEDVDASKITHGVLPYAVDKTNAQKLWGLSADLLKLKHGIF
jgi:NAD(P)-dependent dehydrogenase (short-subunit alcohol dehydrogenase family)